MSEFVRQAALALLLLSTWFRCSASASDRHGAPIYVKADESIQAAIDTSYPGQLIIVEAGTYAEQLTINTHGLQLVGRGAVLVPPSTFMPNICSGLAGPDTEAGICITGQGVEVADFVVEHRKVLSVGTPVKDVLVTGFEVKGFSGLDISVVGGQDVVVTGNLLYDGAQYGCLTVGSKNTHVDANTVASSTADVPFIGICMDDMSDVRVTNNHIDGYVIGLCVQTNDAYVFGNDVHNTCYGVFVDPGVTGAQILNNHFDSGNPVCLTIPGGDVGVLLSGPMNTVVRGNLVEGWTANGAPNGTSGGLAIIDDPTGAIASGNMVTNNVLRNNDYDVYVQTTGTGNVVEGNQCSISVPAGLCG
ncbi:pectin lyase fold/virulence factor [Exophiala viscosa]|uniref:pectin lyase fold/virulence factor n=1 Tax=Exophiala viscosa TaxID=2486360 RepID=UPI00219419B6|nr:pectin lyase fold/virulence factor [Exophiala viscosa]